MGQVVAMVICVTVWRQAKTKGDGSKQLVLYVDGGVVSRATKNGVVFLGIIICLFLVPVTTITALMASKTYLDDVRFYNRALSADEVQVQAGAFL